MTKVFVEGPDQLICKMFVEEGFTIVDSLDEADLLCLEGGADVTPALYGEENTHSHNSVDKDIESLALIIKARMVFDIPVVGICRGAQILNVVNGGKMIQHVSGHAGTTHNLYWEGESYEVTSAHHQACVPLSEVTGRIEEGQDFIIRAPDGNAEVIEYGGVMLCFQPHPEYVGANHPCRELFFELLEGIL